MRTKNLAEGRATLWAAADELRANSKLTAAQYRDPVLDHVLAAYGDNHDSAYSPRIDIGYSDSIQAEFDGAFDAQLVVLVDEDLREECRITR